jgi:hypothetical protein
MTDQYPSYDLTIYKNGTKRLLLKFREDDGTTVIPLTGATAKMQFRDRPGGELYLTLTSSDGLVINEAAGTVYIDMSNVNTNLLDLDEGSFDLLVTIAGVNDYPIHGTFKIQRNTTE